MGALFPFNRNELFGLGRLARDHSLTKAASRSLFVVRRYATQRDFGKYYIQGRRHGGGTVPQAPI